VIRIRFSVNLDYLHEQITKAAINTVHVTVIDKGIAFSYIIEKTCYHLLALCFF